MNSSATLYTFVDPKDPFVETEVAGEEQPGPVLSVLGSRAFDSVVLFYTPHTEANAAATFQAIKARRPKCEVIRRRLEIADPKNYSVLMGALGNALAALDKSSEAYVCVSSGTAEMRAAWFLLNASGFFKAKLLQVGTPIDPLFGAANVSEVDVGNLDLVMPQQFFAEPRPASLTRMRPATAVRRNVVAAAPLPAQDEPYIVRLEEALQELGIFVGSAQLRVAAERAAIVAEGDHPVLILGETGTGKELFAKLIHRLSERSGRSLVPVNCAAIPKELAESFLFGHTRGAFTGAAHDQKGKFELADEGTLFLDEIGELTMESQAKLLRVLQDGVIEPLGSGKPKFVNVRIVAATNRDLPREIADGRFREDLYYRLEVVQIPLPALRNRREEIVALAAGMLKRINQRRKTPRRLSKEALARLEQHDWPGNVRELSNVLERSVMYAKNDILQPDDLLIEHKSKDVFGGLPDPCEGFQLDEFLGNVRRKLILRALELSHGNQSAAAQLLGISKQAISQFRKDNAD